MKLQKFVNNKIFSTIFFIFILFILQGDSIFLGERARLEFGDGEMLFHGYFQYLVNEKKSSFLHDVVGGVDRYALGRIGGAIFSGRLFLIEHMPFWLVVIFLRILTTSFAFFSMYFFLKNQLKSSKLNCLCCATLFSSCFDFNTSMTFLYGLSISSIPLLLYFFLNLKKTIKLWLMYITFSLIYVWFSDPFFWLPSLWFLTIVTLMWLKPKSYFYLLVSISFLSIIWCFNYSEAIFSVIQNVEESSRPNDLSSRNSFPILFKWMLYPKLEYNAGGLAFFFVLVFSLYTYLKTKNFQVFLSVISVIILSFASSLLILIPWEKFHLNFLNSYSWYIQYFAFPLSIIVFSNSIKIFLNFSNKKDNTIKNYKLYFPIAFSLAISCAMIFNYKMHTVLHILTRGNLSIFQNIPNLKNIEWYNKNTRVIGVPTKYDPNISSSYGLSSYDGGATFVPRTNYISWTNLILKDIEKPNFASPGIPTINALQKCCDPYELDKIINFEMLRLFNISYIISFKELSSENVIKLSGPKEQKQKPFFKRLFDKTEPVFIYKLVKKPHNQIYAAKDYLILNSKNIEDYFNYIKRLGLKKFAVFFDLNENFKSNLPDKLNDIEFKFNKIKDGYNITITKLDKGLLIVNIPPLKWWSITDQNEEKLNFHQTNVNQVAIIVNKNTSEVKIRYKRPLLFD